MHGRGGNGRMWRKGRDISPGVGRLPGTNRSSSEKKQFWWNQTVPVHTCTDLLEDRRFQSTSHVIQWSDIWCWECYHILSTISTNSLSSCQCPITYIYQGLKVQCASVSIGQLCTWSVNAITFTCMTAYKCIRRQPAWPPRTHGRSFSSRDRDCFSESRHWLEIESTSVSAIRAFGYKM